MLRASIATAVLALCAVGAMAADECFVPTGGSKQFCVNATTGTMYTSDVPAGHKDPTSSLASDTDTFYILICGALVFFMQTGFGMLEAGSVSEKNVINILYKNVMDASIAAVFFWLLGYSFAYGDDTDGPFIGAGNWAVQDDVAAKTGMHGWFFQWAFAATAATIVAGSVAERCKLEAYFIYSIVLTVFIYPVVVHWVWDGQGWLTAWGDEAIFSDTKDGPGGSNGMIDFAGCAVVHMVGGFAGLVAAILIGPRTGRFDPAHPDPVPHNQLLATMGTLFLWYGWYGFNCGSTLAIAGQAETAARVAMTTTLAAAGGCCCAALMGRLIYKSFDLMLINNGILGGLVSITSACAFVDPWASFVIGIIGALVYKGSSELLVKLKIDDPLDAAPVHGFCGIWGALAPGIFATDELAGIVLGTNNDCISSGLQFGIQLTGVAAVLAWTLATSFILFTFIKFTVGLRVPEDQEREGLDKSEHDGKAYAYVGVSAPKQVAVKGSDAGRKMTEEGVEMAGTTPVASS